MALLRRALLGWALSVCVVGSSARAHTVPIPPSTCQIEAMVMSNADDALPAARAVTDGLRLTYDANASIVRMCTTTADDPATCAAVAAREFAIGSTTASLALPQKASAVLTTTGDMEFEDVPIVVTAGTTVTLPITLTTGLVTLDGRVIEGAPVKGFAPFTLRGVLPGASLPAAFGGQSLLLTLSCSPRPIPDVDQFVPSSRVGGLRGTLDAGTLRLRAAVRIGPAESAALGRAPLLLNLRMDDLSIATAVFSQIDGRGRRVRAVSDDGRTAVTFIKQGSQGFAMSVAIDALTLPSLQGPAIVGVTLDSGRFLARGERLFRPTATGGWRRR